MATKKSNKKDPLKSKTEWTITEFQMWLHGAYSLQGEDWVPNAEQWDTILDIIYKLKAPKASNPALAAQRTLVPQQQPQHIVQHGGNLPPIPEGGPMSSPGGSFLNDSNFPPEASLPLSELRKRSAAGGPANSNVLGGGGPGDKEIKTGSFD